MALVNNTFDLDITPGAIPQVVNVSEYDVGREYTVTLKKGGDAWSIPSGTTATVEGTIGGSAFSETATVSGNAVTFALSEAMTAKAGDVWSKIKLVKDSEPIQTCAFILRCDRAGVEAGTVIGANGFENQIQNAVDANLASSGFGVVRYDTSVTLTDAQKQVARDNISAVSTADHGKLEGNVVSFADSVGHAIGDIATPLVFRPGYYNTASPTSGTVVERKANDNYVCAICPVTKGDTVVINATGSSGVYRLWDVLNSEMKTIRYANPNTSGLVTVTIQDDTAAYIVINNYLPTQPSGYYAFKGVTISERIEAVESSLSDGFVTLDSILSHGTDGVFTESFNLTVPYNGDSRNQIFTCEASYTLTGDALPPTIQFMLGTGLNGSTEFELGGKGSPTLKQWRVVRYPTDTTNLTVKFIIPSGCSVTITEFRNEYSDQVCRVNSGIRINAHRRMPTTPYDTAQGAILAAKSGYAAMIQIPKRTSDGVWICYHDDSMNVSGTYIRQADGTNLPSSYNGKTWSEISYAEAEIWDWGISKHARFAGTKPMTLEQFFTICAKTGMRPMLSVHPLPSDSELEEIKEIARKCGVLSKLGLKGASTFVAPLYRVFGNDVESYTYNVSSGTQGQSVVELAISIMNGLSGCTARKVIELFKSTAYAAYFGTNQYDAFGLIADAGIECALAQQSAVGSPTGYTSQTQYFYGADMEWWAAQHGVTEFTDEYNWSTGLNW